MQPYPFPNLSDLLLYMVLIYCGDRNFFYYELIIIYRLYKIKLGIKHFPVFPREVVNKNFIKHCLAPVISPVRKFSLFPRP